MSPYWAFLIPGFLYCFKKTVVYESKPKSYLLLCFSWLNVVMVVGEMSSQQGLKHAEMISCYNLELEFVNLPCLCFIAQHGILLGRLSSANFWWRLRGWICHNVVDVIYDDRSGDQCCVNLISVKGRTIRFPGWEVGSFLKKKKSPLPWGWKKIHPCLQGKICFLIFRKKKITLAKVMRKKKRWKKIPRPHKTCHHPWKSNGASLMILPACEMLERKFVWMHPYVSLWSWVDLLEWQINGNQLGCSHYQSLQSVIENL